MNEALIDIANSLNKKEELCYSCRDKIIFENKDSYRILDCGYVCEDCIENEEGLYQFLVDPELDYDR